MNTLALINQKGGTAKSSSSREIGAALILKGYRVLFVDLDGQQNLTLMLGADPNGPTLADLLQQRIEPAEPGMKTADAIQHTPGGDIIAASAQLAAADTILADINRREYLLKEILQPVKRSYDFCVIDCPPTLGTLAINALTAAQAALVPAQADLFSLVAISQLYSTITTVRQYSNPGLILKGIFLTRYNNRAVISRDIAEQISAAAAAYGTKLYATRIRECTALKEAAYTQQSIFDYSPRSNAAKDYLALVNEILEKG